MRDNSSNHLPLAGPNPFKQATKREEEKGHKEGNNDEDMDTSETGEERGVMHRGDEKMDACSDNAYNGIGNQKEEVAPNEIRGKGPLMLLLGVLVE